MSDRLDAADVALLHAEENGAPQHVGTVSICHDPGRRVDHASVVGLVRRQLASVPRYRQVVREVPGRLVRPVWVDDASFDLNHHVRRSTLPRPGGDTELRELVARVMSRPLDRSRPLWELYVVEGLAGDRVALVGKTHHALVDGRSTVDLAQLLLTGTAAERVQRHEPDDAEDSWRAGPTPSNVGLVVDALVGAARRPSQVVDAVRDGVSDARGTAVRLASAANAVAAAARTAVLPTGSTPRAGTVAQRLFTTADSSLADHRTVRSALGGTVNDVILATVAGALRAWLLSRGDLVAPGATVRAVVPVSVHAGPNAGGHDVSSYLVDLPVGEPSPVLRLLQVGHATQAHKDTGTAASAESLVQLPGFAPPTLHVLGARVTSTATRRSSHLVVTNAPGPQAPVYVAGARLLRSYPVPSLPAGQSLGIGVTSYDGGVYYGLHADRDAMPDVARMARCLTESLAELVRVAR